MTFAHRTITYPGRVLTTLATNHFEAAETFNVEPIGVTPPIGAVTGEMLRCASSHSW